MQLNLTPEQVARFWSRVQKSDGCWLWTAGGTKDGYGSMRVGKGTMRTHRIAWLLAGGDIPTGLEVCHSCDVDYAVGDVAYRRCCRPEHLFLATHVENIADMDRKGRRQNRPPTGDNHGLRKHPERAARGERHNSRTHPELLMRGERHTSAKLTDDDVRQMRRLYAEGGWSYRTLASRFGVTPNTAWVAVIGRQWKHVS